MILGIISMVSKNTMKNFEKFNEYIFNRSRKKKLFPSQHQSRFKLRIQPSLLTKLTD